MEENILLIYDTKYKAIECESMNMICSECCFHEINNELTQNKKICQLPTCDISCIGDLREDGRNIYWRKDEKE